MNRKCDFCGGTRRNRGMLADSTVGEVYSVCSKCWRTLLSLRYTASSGLRMVNREHTDATQAEDQP